MSNYSPDKIISLLREKDKNAIKILYAQYAKPLYGVILKVVEDQEIAKDVLQEVFCKIWQRFPQYDSSRGRLFTWMLNIARNAAIDKTRSKAYKQLQRYKKMEPIDENIVDNEKKTYSYVKTSELIKFTHKLHPKYQELITLVYFKGYSQSEVSKELQIPLGTVKTRIRTAINLLRKMMLV